MIAKDHEDSNDAGNGMLRDIEILNHAHRATLGPDERSVAIARFGNRRHTLDAIATDAPARAH